MSIIVHLFSGYCKIYYFVLYCYLGIPNLGIVPIDPLRIITMELDQNNGGPVNLKLKFQDLDIHNIKYAQMTKAQ